jgi:hypothetical protein
VRPLVNEQGYFIEYIVSRDRAIFRTTPHVFVDGAKDDLPVIPQKPHCNLRTLGILPDKPFSPDEEVALVSRAAIAVDAIR